MNVCVRYVMCVCVGVCVCVCVCVCDFVYGVVFYVCEFVWGTPTHPRLPRARTPLHPPHVKLPEHGAGVAGAVGVPLAGVARPPALDLARHFAGVD